MNTVPNEIDRALRLLGANGLPHRLLADALAMPIDDVDATALGSRMRLGRAERARLDLSCAILIRLDIRFGQEPRSVRQALSAPHDTLDARTLEQVMATGLDGLRAVHRAVSGMVLPAERWWRNRATPVREIGVEGRLRRNEGNEGELSLQKGSAKMNSRTEIDTDTAHRALTEMITAANGGAMPDTFKIHIERASEQAAFVYDPADQQTKLLVTVETDGRLNVAVGVATSWTTLFHADFRFALTPGGQLVLLGRHGGRPMFFTIEDDRLLCDTGSPLLSVLAEADAMAAFAAVFAALTAEVR